MENSSPLLQSRIKKPIGNNLDSDPEDIKNTRKNFQTLGLDSGNPEHPLIDRALDTTIRGFQRGLGLKEDGKMTPNGETEESLNKILQLSDNVKNLPPLPKRNPRTQIKKQINELDIKISQKSTELQKIKSHITGMATAAGGLMGGLSALALLKNQKSAKKAAGIGAGIGAERGHAIAEAAIKSLQVEIDLLKIKRDKLKSKLREIEQQK